MKVWAWHGVPNFGDRLGIELLKRIGKWPIEEVELIEQADLISIGSILNTQRIRTTTMVWGSGFIKVPLQMPRKDLNYLALRGEVTKELIYGHESPDVKIPLGDPGLLVSRYWPKATRRKYKIGVVPHYVDKRKFSWADKVIDVAGEIDDVVRDISSCSVIMSSSLHGIVVADSFGIPSMRLHHAEVIGGDFKWADYISARTRPLNEIQESLLKALP